MRILAFPERRTHGLRLRARRPQVTVRARFGYTCPSAQATAGSPIYVCVFMCLPASQLFTHAPICLRVHSFAHPSSQPSFAPSLGTMGYIPPEAMRRASCVEVSSVVYKKWDVYSFAVLMCYTLSGVNPFAHMSDAQITVMIVCDRKRPSIPSHVDADPDHPVFKRMIQRLWHSDPLKRDGFPAIVQQLNKHVTDPNLKRTVEQTSTSRQFLRTLPPLLAGAQNRRVCFGLALCLRWLRDSYQFRVCMLSWSSGA